MDQPIDIVALRDELGWTQQQFADYFDVDRTTISNWQTEPPTKGPALILLRQLAASVRQGAVAGPAASQGGAGQSCGEGAPA
ncbi:helix-turn-helix domain-containing protein [Mesorhizobium captivum]|uniref:helix-turn-helix domain-containing protein n=1 Tax=Mesorhizobium captivum TaxID=3072319 RepID=UPI002A246888|nr:helix-turn-helix domain-containing protein [Mesorhizobium sp. VK23E]MDX8513568.1 helix-turn-helix domain-containing protein [Mesorhizobium sp. VK23E]